MNYNQYKAMVRIDKLSLDTELEQHPVLFQGVCERVAKAAHEEATAREEQKEISGRLLGTFRGTKNPATDKMRTVDECNALVEQEDEHKAARASYKAASLKLARWSGLKEAYMQRSYALKSLADLFMAQYYSTPTAFEKKKGG